MGFIEELTEWFMSLFEGKIVKSKEEEGKPAAETEAPTIDRTDEVTAEAAEAGISRTEPVEPEPPVEPVERPSNSPKDVASATETVGSGETIEKSPTRRLTPEEMEQKMGRQKMAYY